MEKDCLLALLSSGRTRKHCVILTVGKDCLLALLSSGRTRKHSVILTVALSGQDIIRTPFPRTDKVKTKRRIKYNNKKSNTSKKTKRV